ncbi:hypothetical protein KC19_1G315400 [Ceratodon purpureus]|uniref:Uncharacterized protein n=1 Tax=Ceratodon purpureus TaxID=3225 RepID=A0A8T0JBS3_CERPU|nr:hypothetical protein KC19_1G315400 [Ceratodon purpureus]
MQSAAPDLVPEQGRSKAPATTNTSSGSAQMDPTPVPNARSNPPSGSEATQRGSSGEKQGQTLGQLMMPSSLSCNQTRSDTVCLSVCVCEELHRRGFTERCN